VSPLDVAALSILGVAVLRGFFRGAVREAFSLAALAASVVVVRWASPPAGAWLAERAPVDLGGFGAQIAAGAAIGIVTILSIAIVGRFVRRGIRLAGLGMLDRLAGGVVGVTEGALLVAVLLILGITVVGREHPALSETRTLAAFEQAELIAQGRLDLPSVAAPPRD